MGLENPQHVDMVLHQAVHRLGLGAAVAHSGFGTCLLKQGLKGLGDRPHEVHLGALSRLGEAQHVELDEGLKSLEDNLLNVGVLGVVAREARVVGEVHVGVGLVVD